MLLWYYVISTQLVMNRTVTVNLSGMVFAIDDDAYNVLKGYFDELNVHFKEEPGRQEILDDIEARIADLFRSGIKLEQQVICIADVNRVIGIMGRPSQLDDEAEDQGSAGKTYSRMYRDVDDKIIGGICSGMGYYWRIEPLLFRIFFVISSFWGGLGVVLYVVLWIVVPTAETTAQKLEMRGKSVNAENFRKNSDNNK